MDNCLLCLQKKKEFVDGIKVDSLQWQKYNVTHVIEKHFWIMESLLPASWLCITCWEALYSFHQFYMDIEKAHRDFGKLIPAEDAFKNLEENKEMVLKVEIYPDILIDQYPNEDFELNIKEEQDYQSNENISKSHSKDEEPKNEDPLKTTTYSNTFFQQSNKNEEICKRSKTQSSKKTKHEIKNENQEHKVSQTPIKAKKKYNMRRPKQRPEEVAKFLAEHFKMTCPICEIPMTDWEALSKHFEIVHKERTYAVCCKRKFVRRSELRDHVHVRHVDPDKFKCNQCGKTFSRELFLENHILRHLPEESFKQSTQEMEKTNQELEILQTPPNANKKYNIRVPKKKPKEVAKLLAEHFKITCAICQIPMTDWEALGKHFQVEHKERTYAVCCKRKFVRRSELWDHVYVRHVNPDKYKCNECGKSFGRESVLENHILRHLPEEEKEFACPECGKKFAKQNFLDCHVRAVHLKRYMKICEICGKSIYPEELARHMLEHEGKSLPTVYCEICGVAISQMKLLKIHMKNQHPEGGKQAATCTICNKVLASAACLRRHMDYVHTKNIRKCILCGKGFKSKKCLTNHMATHTGIALHTCKWCPKTFYAKGNMSSHNKKYHPVEYAEELQKRHLKRFKQPVEDETHNIGS